ncbi:hypothetical protein T484DRAFT_3640395 [Baffinella frigidus]|nr:hypothetical protein T484DRAFT_3640395 [Cryptophyta sp. CCMP2293]
MMALRVLIVSALAGSALSFVPSLSAPSLLAGGAALSRRGHFRVDGQSQAQTGRTPRLKPALRCRMSGKEVLSKEDRGKDNPAPDAYHYDYPRLCYHADAAFHATLTDLYDKELPPSGDEVRVLDLCSSWVSHYPSERQWGRVDGLGLNREELLKNPLLDFFQVRDLNQNRTLPYPDSVFDAVTCALSFQYMQYPEEVVAELSRVMKPGGVAVVSFSNRMFPSKAIYGT